MSMVLKIENTPCSELLNANNPCGVHNTLVVNMNAFVEQMVSKALKAKWEPTSIPEWDTLTRLWRMLLGDAIMDMPSADNWNELKEKDPFFASVCSRMKSHCEVEPAPGPPAPPAPRSIDMHVAPCGGGAFSRRFYTYNQERYMSLWFQVNRE